MAARLHDWRTTQARQVPAEVAAARERAYEIEAQRGTPNSSVLGDPVAGAGRSALDQRRKGLDSIHTPDGDQPPPRNGGHNGARDHWLGLRLALDQQRR